MTSLARLQKQREEVLWGEWTSLRIEWECRGTGARSDSINLATRRISLVKRWPRRRHDSFATDTSSRPTRGWK